MCLHMKHTQITEIVPVKILVGQGKHREFENQIRVLCFGLPLGNFPWFGK